jgi:parallel beta-helix repeat protein
MDLIQTIGRKRTDSPPASASRLAFHVCHAVALSSLGFCSAVAQQTIHVPADQPTIQAGINAAQNGDTVLVAPGIYNENIDFKGNAITVTSGAKSYSDAAATIINGVANGSVVNLSTNEPATTVLNGFTIQGGHYLNAPPGAIIAGVAIVGSSPTVTNNIVQQNIGCGILAYAGASPLIQGNDIRQNRAPVKGEQLLSGGCVAGVQAGTGLAINSAGTVTVTGNVVEENTTIGNYNSNSSINGGGIFIILTDKVVLANNIVRNNQGGGFNGLQTGLGGGGGANTIVMVQNLFYTDSSTITNMNNSAVFIGGSSAPSYPTVVEINNTFYSKQGLQLTYAAGSVIENNIFYQPDPQGSDALTCTAGAQTSPITLSHNDIFRVGGVSSSGCTLGPGNLAADPQFVNPAGGDFHTQRNSPVVADGDINAPQIPPMDLDSRARTVCGTIDMGVYEVHPQPATVVTSSNNPSVGGTSVTFTAQVPGNCNIPTGTVTFLDGTNPLGTVPLSVGASASLSTANLTVGKHTITVSYPGDYNFDASTSVSLIQVVTGYPTSTTLAVTPNPAIAFAPIQLSSTVSSNFGQPTGSVVFTDGGQTVATAPLDGKGNASATISTLGAGTYNIVATYSADVNFAASSSPPVIEKVIGADSATSVTASPNPATYGQTVTFKAVVRATQGSAVPTGSVTFSGSGATLGSATLDGSGAASFSTSTLSVGTHTITTNYSGSGNFNPSSTSINETITAIATTLALTASPNPAALGQPVTIVATATDSTPSQTPSGTVTIFDGSVMLGTAVLNASGHASLVTTSLVIGKHTFTATYSGGTTFGGSTSPAIQETILPFSFTLALSPSTITLHAGQPGTVAIQLSSVGLFAGPVTLSYGALPQYASASLNSSSVALVVGGTGTAVLTLNTVAKTVGSNQLSKRPGFGGLPSVFAATAILLLPFGAARRKRMQQIIGIVVVAISLQTLTGCTNSYYVANLVAPGTYRVIVTATDSNNNSNTSNITVVVVP